MIHPDDVQRTVDLGVIPAVQGIFACSDGPWVVDRLGPERTLERGYIFNTLAEAGAVPTNGTDPPVDEIDPIGSFYCSVTRILPDGTEFQPQVLRQDGDVRKFARRQRALDILFKRRDRIA